jgi:Protein of unknown function (DUF3099)
MPMLRWRRVKEKDHHVVTGAGTALSIEQRTRQRKYFISMMIRTACFIAAIFLSSPWRWFSLLGALTLPYIAVVVANAGRERGDSDQIVSPQSQRQLP